MMNKIAFIFIMLHLGCSSYGQSFVRQELSIINSKKHAAKFGILRTSVYESKVSKQRKDSTLILSEIYDSSGNILEKIDYHYTKKRDFEHRQYLYDSLGNRLREFSEISFLKEHLSNYYKYHYNGEGDMVSMEFGSGELGAITFRKINPTKIVVDSSTFCIFDSLHRLSKVIHDTGMYDEYKYEKNLLCINKFEDYKLWQTAKFDSNERLIEERSFFPYRSKFWSHLKIIYMPNGLIDYQVELNQKGKPIKVKKYYYKLHTVE